MLFGQDNCELIITREFREIIGKNLLVSRCSLGWSIHGSNIKDAVKQVNLIAPTSTKKQLSKNKIDCDLDKIVKLYFDIDSIGVNTYASYNPEDDRALKILESTSRRVDNVWEVGLLWKRDDTDFPNGRSQALRRLFLLEKRLDRDANYANLYYREMDRLFEEGFAERVDNKPNNNRVWYLPHFGVQNVNKPGKVRLVFDAAAKSANTSFNDLLLSGPDLLKSLPGVIMRFRQFAYAVKADIKDMFLKIKIRPEDRDAQRFLWRGKDRSLKPKEYAMSSLIFGAKSSPCAALYIKNKNAALFLSQYPATAISLTENCYMDDFLDSCISLEEISRRVSESIEINANANWQMHGWASNVESILENANLTNNSESLIKINSEPNYEKVLGLKWLNISDELSFNLNLNKINKDLYDGDRKPTKREFLSIIMSIFDPLGFLTPFTIQSRILMQAIWTSKVSWDEVLHEAEYLSWKQWLRDLKFVKECRISRCYQLKHTQSSSAELHIFSDASSKAYATVGYWRFLLNDGSFHVSFIMSKSRVAPLKVISIPRLELQAAVLATRIARMIASEHKIKITRRLFWCDSKSVLQWIRKDPRDFKVFVANRLGEIRESTEISEWKWVPSKENAADDGTRIAPESLNNDSRWFVGPPFLRKPETQWPIENFQSKYGDDASELLVKSNRAVCNLTELPLAIDPVRFSSWTRLVSTVTQVLKAIDIWKRRIRTSTERFLKAEAICFKMSQVSSFHVEINAIKKNSLISKTSRIINLNVYIDELGILRANSRITNLAENDSLKRPIILDAKDTIAQLLIKHYHERYYHANHESVLNEIKQKFWVVGLRNALRSISAKCLICKIQRARPCNPKMAALPPARLAYQSRPFSHCGMDYFGPMLVKIGRRREKRWGAIFTCMSTRAVHLELAHSLSTDSAICALRRFAARRGTPLRIYCDNGTNFRGMSIELTRAIREIDQSQIGEFATKNKIEWVFNPPTASHMGGAWERLIRSIKTSLAVVLKEHAPKEETLLTILAEIEHAVNSRPLTHVSLDPRDDEALTPNHFLLGASSGQIRINKYDVQTLCTKKQWQIAQHFADAFWRRWLREYVPTLIPRKKWQYDDDPLKINDVVLILDTNTERNQWKKGIVTRIFPGTDGQVRVVELRTASGVLLRPTRKLVKFAN